MPLRSFLPLGRRRLRRRRFSSLRASSSLRPAHIRRHSHHPRRGVATGVGVPRDGAVFAGVVSDGATFRRGVISGDAFGVFRRRVDVNLFVAGGFSRQQNLESFAKSFAQKFEVIS